METRFSRDFAGVRVTPLPRGSMSAKGAIGSPSSSFEVEADRVAQLAEAAARWEERREPGARAVDFHSVRVHDDAMAAASARAVNASAYTWGNHIVFSRGAFSPRTASGRRLLTHELTHVLQQTGHLPLVQRDLDEDAGPQGSAAARSTGQAGAGSEMDASPTEKTPAPEGKGKKEAKPKPIPSCDRKILAEGSCAALVHGSSWVCCDHAHGIEDPTRTKSSVEGQTPCPSNKWTPIFTCDSTCAKALANGCSDSDNWMAIPGDQFTRAKCGDVYTICANGKQTSGYVRDRSVTAGFFEVSPGIQTALGVKIGDSFQGAIYRPGAKQATIDKDPCCNPP